LDFLTVHSIKPWTDGASYLKEILFKKMTTTHTSFDALSFEDSARDGGKIHMDLDFEQ
jgi:hypothetical protein